MADLPCALRQDQQRHFTPDDRTEGSEPDVTLPRIGFASGGVAARRVQHFRQFRHRPVVFLLGLAEGPPSGPERARVERSRRIGRPGQNHPRGRVDVHLFHGPAVEVDDGRLAADAGPAAAEASKPARSHHRVSNTVRARNRQVLT